jgi:hypothetical protein
MLRIFIENCKWGADNTDEGMQMNFLDEDSGFMVHIPFNFEALDAMEEMIKEARENQNKAD